MKVLDRLFASSLIAWSLAGAMAASSVTSDRTLAGNESAAVLGTAPESALKWAMSADAVREIMGQPDRITPMKAPNGKAEVWVFTRESNRHLERVPVGVVPIMDTTQTVVGSCRDNMPGPTTTQKVGETIVYADVTSATVETVELLMFNEHYVTHKISRENVRHHN